MLFRGHCCLSLSTDNCNALSLHKHDKLLILVADCFQRLSAFLTQRKASSIPTVFSWSGNIRPEGFLSSILLLAVIIDAVAIIVAVVMVVLIVVDAIIRVVVVVVESSSVVKLSFAVTFPSILLGNPPMKASMSFSVFGTMFGHKTANSWNLLTPSDLIGLIYSNRLGVCIPPGQGIISQGVPVGPVFLLGLLVLAIVAAWASRAATTLSATSFLMAA
ncbi:hypothetical protein Tco_1478456 [Tanacetum coccineum]